MTSSKRPSPRPCVPSMSHPTHARRSTERLCSVEVNMFVPNVCVLCRALVDGAAVARPVRLVRGTDKASVAALTHMCVQSYQKL